MLSIYVGKENKPTEYIHDADNAIALVGIPDTELSRIVLTKLERATYLDTFSFIDREGYKLPLPALSTGNKILLLAAYSGKSVNGAELGQNAFELLAQYVNGSIYLEDPNRFELPEYFELSSVSVNGKVYDSIIGLENALWIE